MKPEQAAFKKFVTEEYRGDIFRLDEVVFNRGFQLGQDYQNDRALEAEALRKIRLAKQKLRQSRK